MTIRNLARPSNPSLPALSPSTERLESINTAQIVFKMLSQAIAAGSCIENSQRLLDSLDCNPSPDKCIDLLRRTLLSLNQIFHDFPPQSDDEVIRESWLAIETVRARIRSALLKLEDLKNGPERPVDLYHNIGVNRSV